MKVYYILTLFLFTACTQAYFDFDEIIHYHFPIADDDGFKYSDIENKTHTDSLFDNILTQYEPSTVRDTIFLNSLELQPIKKSIIDPKLFKDFQKIFTSRYHSKITEMACLPVFRDVLVFRKNKKTIGIAKICFHCDQNYIIGTSANTVAFGQSGDYKKLYNLLYSK